MNGNDIIKRIIAGEFYHNFHQVKYLVCDDNTLVVLADFRLDCGVVDKILHEHTFKHNIWISFCDNGTVIDEVPRITGKAFKVTEYLYHPSVLNEEDIVFIKEAVLNIKNGVLDDSHNNPDSDSPTVRLKTTYCLTVEQNGISKKVRGEWGNKEEATGIGLRLYKNHKQDEYIVFLVTVLRFPQVNGTVREMPFPCKIENITESKTNKNMKNTIKLNESQLRQIVAESVKKVLKEGIRDIEGLGEEIRDAEGIAYELREKIGALQSKVNTIYGYMPTNTDEYDDGVKKYLENAYSAIKQCVFALDDAFQFYDGGA